MEVRCDFYGPLREAVGTKSVSRQVPSGATVGDVLEGVAEDHPDLEDLLFSDGELSRTAHVSRNTRHVRLESGLETPVEDGDVLRAYPPVEGGSPPI